MSPGFIDCHVHLLNPKDGDHPFTSPGQEGRTAEIIACGQALCATGGHGEGICDEYDGIEGVRRGVRRLVTKGADIMKNPGASSWVSSLDRKFIILARNRGPAN